MADPQPARVLVLSAPAGAGHAVAASRIRLLLQRVLGQQLDVSVSDVGDFMRVGGRPVRRELERAYNRGISASGGRGHVLAYRLIDRHPDLARRAFDASFGRQITAAVVEHGPSVVISTFHAVSAMLSMRLSGAGIPLISVVPGAGRVNRLWFVGALQTLVVADRLTASCGMSAGVPEQRIAVLPGIFAPSAPKHYTPPDARNALGLEDRFTVLVSLGSMGLWRRAGEVVELLLRDPQIQVVVNPGTNTGVRADMQRRGVPVVPTGSELVPYMAAADLVVGKAGWLTLSEAEALRRPTLIVDYIRGQEDENVRAAVAAGVAIAGESGDMAARRVSAYAAQPERLRRDFPGLDDGSDPAGYGASADALANLVLRAVRPPLSAS